MPRSSHAGVRLAMLGLTLVLAASVVLGAIALLRGTLPL